jgi:DNA-binding NtrC family response regulator
MKTRPRILIVDDDKNTREGLARALSPDYTVTLAESGERALSLLDESAVDIMLSDVRMPGMDGMTLLQRALARTPAPISIMLTAYGNVETAVEAMKRGAYDFLMKPVNLDYLDMLLKRALRSREVEDENVSLKEELDDRYGLENMIGNSQAMREVFEVVKQAAPTNATVLLQGESGTGKELVAHAIHRLSPRRNGPFIAVHCAALSPTLLESELFGHEKGAFTGAVERRRGRFEMADGGTLFLDEVSEIDPAIQVKLLRVLEERRFERVGGSETLEVDIRLIAATNRNLKALADEGRFRSDLYFRLDVVGVVLPLLRDRAEDIPLLAYHFLREFAHKNGKPLADITPEAMQIFSAYSWPGNVRELRNAIERMVVLARGSKLTARDVPVNIRNAVQAEAGQGRGPELAAVGAAASLASNEKALIYSALRRFKGNRTQAAAQLGISRRTLQRKLKEYAVAANAVEPPEKTPATSPSASA